MDNRNIGNWTKIVLIGFFIAVFIGVVELHNILYPGTPLLQLSALDLVLLGFATVRMGRLIAYDQVMEPLRKPFAKTVPDWTGAGETTEPRGKGVRHALGELITCPICSGTWAASMLVYGLVLLPGPTRVFITILAAIGIGEVLNYVIEALSWTGHLQRLRIGAWEEKKEALTQEELLRQEPGVLVYDGHRDRRGSNGHARGSNGKTNGHNGGTNGGFKERARVTESNGDRDS